MWQALLLKLVRLGALSRPMTCLVHGNRTIESAIETLCLPLSVT